MRLSENYDILIKKCIFTKVTNFLVCISVIAGWKSGTDAQNLGPRDLGIQETSRCLGSQWNLGPSGLLDRVSSLRLLFHFGYFDNSCFVKTRDFLYLLDLWNFHGSNDLRETWSSWLKKQNNIKTPVLCMFVKLYVRGIHTYIIDRKGKRKQLKKIYICNFTSTNSINNRWEIW